MNETSSVDPGAVPRRGQLNQAVRESLRDLSIQMSLLSNRIGGHLDLKGTDLECLDLIDRYGPLSPSALARRAGQPVRSRCAAGAQRCSASRPG